MTKTWYPAVQGTLRDKAAQAIEFKRYAMFFGYS